MLRSVLAAHSSRTGRTQQHGKGGYCGSARPQGPGVASVTTCRGTGPDPGVAVRAGHQAVGGAHRVATWHQIGHYALGPAEDRVNLTFNLEAKCYSVSSSVRTAEMSHLISRLRHREFGVMVTTSYVHKQAYEEIRSDGHPIIVMSGIDIVRTLRARGLGSVMAVREWLEREFPAE